MYLFYIINHKRNLKQFIRLIANIYQYKIENIILLKGTLCIPPKSKTFSFNFPDLILKQY